MFGFSVRAISAVMTIFYFLTSMGIASIPPVVEESAALVTNIPLGTSAVPAVNILQSMPEISLELQQAAELFTAESGLQVHVETVSGRADYRSAMRSRLLAGDPVDLFHLLDYSDAQALSSRLEDLSTLPWAEDAAVTPLMLEEQLLGIPYSVQGVGLIINRNIFEAAGIPLGNLVDFETMSDAFGELQDKINDGEFQDSFPLLEAVTQFSAQDTDYLAQYPAEILLSGSFPSAAAAFSSSTVGLPDGAAAEEFFRVLARYSPSRTDWKKLVNVPQNQQVESGIATQRIAVILHDTDIYRRIYAVNPDMEGRLALLPVYLPGWEQGAIFTGTPAYWAINNSSAAETKAGAKELLTWLYQSEEGTALYAKKIEAVSPYRDTAMDTGIALHKQLLGAMDSGRVRPRVWSAAPGHWGEEVFAVELQRYYTTLDMAWSSLVQNCQNGWTAQHQS